MGSGFNFFTNPIDKTPGTTGSWQDVDVSGDGVPAGSTGVILKLIYGGTSSTPVIIAVRKNGSTDDYSAYSKYNTYGTFTVAVVAVDANRIFEAYVGDANCKVWLIGYCDSAVTLFTNIADYSTGTLSAWVDVDVSGSVPAGATGVIVCFIVKATIAGDVAAAVRKNGSTDDFTQKKIHTNFGPTAQYMMIGVDSNRVFEQYIGNANVDLYLCGYTTTPVTFKTNADDISLATAGAWTDDDVTAQTEATADGAIIEILDTATTSGHYHANTRVNGSTDTNTNPAIIHANGHGFICVGLDAQQIFEGWIENAALDFKLIGYCKPAAGATYTKTWQTDVLLKKLGIQKTAVVDAAFQKQGIAKTFSLDSAFTKRTEIQKQVDALFKKLDILKQLGVDVDYIKRNVEKTFAIDVWFGAVLTCEISRQIDVLFKRQGAQKTFAVDTYIGAFIAQTYTKTFTLDVVFRYKVKFPTPLGITTNGQLVFPLKRDMWTGD